MTYPDWRAYESRELEPQDFAAAEALLRDSDYARQDYAAFQEYRSELRKAAACEEIPIARLEAMLRTAQPKTRIPRLLAPLLAGAALAAFGLLAIPRIIESPQVPPQAPMERVAHLATSDPGEAYDWIGKQVGFMIPRYKLTDVAKLTGASAGEGWGAYEYSVDGKPMQLIIRPNAHDFGIQKTTTIGRTTFWEGESVCFKCPYASYELKGGTPENRWRMAKAAAMEIFGGL